MNKCVWNGINYLIGIQVEFGIRKDLEYNYVFR
jgi:hypothetical protein